MIRIEKRVRRLRRCSSTAHSVILEMPERLELGR